MPRYGAKDLCIKLSIADLEATTPKPAKLSCDHKQNLGAIASAFNEGSKNGTLIEKPIYVGHDEHALHFVCKDEDVPFMIQFAGQDLYADAPEGRQNAKTDRLAELSGKSTKSTDDKTVYVAPEPQKVDVPKGPVALCLTVFLSERCFRVPNQWRPAKVKYRDLKIDVFVNGEFCNSAYVSSRFHGDGYRYTEQTKRFTGRRIGESHMTSLLLCRYES